MGEVYRKVMQGKRPRYELIEPTTKVLPDMQIEVEEVVSLINTLVVSVCGMIGDQLPPSDILHRKIRNVNRELVELTSVGFIKPAPVMVDLGVDAWNSMIRAIQDGLLRGSAQP